jgi:Eukaryotic aspartyl protease
MFDTGSTALVLPAKGCTTCGNHTLFDSSQSTSFSSFPDEDVVRDFSTGATTIPIADDEEANCTIVTDVVTLDGLTSSEQMFALCSEYPSAFDDVPMDGILGMGINSELADDPIISSFWNWYGSGLLPEPVFSFYLIPGSAHGAELTLGGIDHSKYKGELTYINLNQNVSALSEAFVIDLDTLFINDEEALVTGNYSTGLCGQPAPFKAGLAALDTGTAFLQTPDKTSAADIYRQISPDITQIDPAGAWGAPCAVLDAVAPKLTFAISSGDDMFHLTLPREFFNLGEYPGHPGICQAAFNNPVDSIEDPTGEGRPVWILGSPFLKSYFTVWDGLNLKVGFAEAGKR